MGQDGGIRQQGQEPPRDRKERTSWAGHGAEHVTWISLDAYNPILVLQRLTEVQPLSQETASGRWSQDVSQKAEPRFAP